MAAEINNPIEAVIRQGKIEPIEPLALPDETRVQVTITRLPTTEAVQEERTTFYRLLQQAGLMDSVPDPNAVPSWKRHPPIEIRGESLSETIIRMRDPDAEW